MTLTPAQKSAKWKSGIESSVDIAQANVSAMSQNDSPAEKAIAQKAKLITNWEASVKNSTFWEDQLGRYSDIETWKVPMLAGLERNRNLTDAQTAKIEEFFDVQSYAISKLDNIITLITDGGNGVEDTGSYADFLHKMFVNLAIESRIDYLNDSMTPQQILNDIAAYLIANFAYTATP